MAADAVSWTISLVDDNTDHPAVKITAKVNPGYHLYSTDNPAGGSMPLQFFLIRQDVRQSEQLKPTESTKLNSMTSLKSTSTSTMELSLSHRN